MTGISVLALESPAVPPPLGRRFLFRALACDFGSHQGGDDPVTSPLAADLRARRPLLRARARAPGSYGRDGERYLDFGAGIAVNALGHAHPHLVAGADRAGRKALAHLQSLSRSRKASGWRSGSSRTTFADVVFFTNSGAEALECAIKMARNYHFGQRPSGALPHHHLRGRLPRPHAGDHRRRRPGRNISKASARRSTASTRCRSATIEALEAAIGPETAAILIEPIQGEGGIRAGPDRIPAAACASSATSTACC